MIYHLSYQSFTKKKLNQDFVFLLKKGQSEKIQKKGEKIKKTGQNDNNTAYGSKVIKVFEGVTPLTSLLANLGKKSLLICIFLSW